MKKARSLAFALMTGLLFTACDNGGTGDKTAPVFKSFTATPSSVTAAGDVTLSADVTDDVGVKSVTFYQGDRMVATDDTAPYTAKDSVTSARNGTLEYHAVAVDAAGNSVKSSSVNVTVNIAVADTIKPTVSVAIDSSTPSAVKVNVTATDDGGIDRVEIYDNGKLVATDKEAPYSGTLNYAAADNGDHTILVKVYDTAGNVTESSSALKVAVGGTTPADTVAPRVSVTPSTTNLTAFGTIIYAAQASDNVGVTKLEFYDNGVLFATLTDGSLSASKAYGPADNGTHTIRVVAYDAQGNKAEASTTVSVNAVNIVDNYEPNDSAQVAAPLSIGTPLYGTIAGKGRDFDYFKFSATAGDRLRLTVMSRSVDTNSSLDPYVTILMPDGKTVLEKDDDSGAGLESDIRFNVPQSGTYYVVVTSFKIQEDYTGQATDDLPSNTYQIALNRR